MFGRLLGVVVVLAMSSAAAAQTVAVESHFAKAKSLVEKNCIDCYGGTQQGLESAIEELQQAIAQGYQDPVATYKLLENAYGNMITYTERNPEQSSAFTAKRLDVVRKLYELAPNDPDVLESYADTLDDKSQHMVILRRILSLEPKRASASFLLGLMLIEGRDWRQGVARISDSVRDEDDAESMMNTITRTDEALRAIGCPLPGPRRWPEDVRLAWEKAEQGAGDPAALPAFKHEFLGALATLQCH